MSYLLDTNACIALITNRSAPLAARLIDTRRQGHDVGVPSIAAFELWFGVANSRHQEANTKALTRFLGGPLPILPFDTEAAEVAGRLRGQLKVMGKPIGSYDLLIAAIALSRKLILVTANTREFGQVPKLRHESWEK